MQADVIREVKALVQFGSEEEAENEDWLIEELGGTRFNRKE